MAEQSRWSSLRSEQQAELSRAGGGTQQSRWAPASSSTSTPAASSSSWRSSSNQSTLRLSSKPSSSNLRPPTDSNEGRLHNKPSNSNLNSNTQASNKASSSNLRHTAGGSGASRWASTPAPSANDGVSTLTSALSSTTLHTSPHATSARSDGLQVRDPHKPLGGKPLNRLSLLASPSRGLDTATSLSSELLSQGSMDLTSPPVQLEYRSYISERLSASLPLLQSSSLRATDPSTYHLGEKNREVGAGEEELQQILLLVRKLREALVASGRRDDFAVEVYELSVWLALLCGDLGQLASSLPRFVTELYHQVPLGEVEGERGDVARLTAALSSPAPWFVGNTHERRLRMVSLELLRTLCLSNRATRLGQYSSSPNDGSNALQSGFREYRSLRTTLSSLYGSSLELHVKFCDEVYSALRDVDPFKFAHLLSGGKRGGGYEVDAWQRLVLLQALPGMRGAIWAVVRKTYLYLPISVYLEGLIRVEDRPAGERREEEAYLASILLLGTDMLPAQDTGKTPKEETPDDWESEAVEAHTGQGREEDSRLHTFLTLQFSPPELTERLTTIKNGPALKLK